MDISKKIFSLFVLGVVAFGASFEARAEMTLQGVTGGYSGYVAPTADASATIYGGMAGSCSSAPTSNIIPCDTCNGGFTACNKRSIYTDLRFNVVIRTNNTSVAVAGAKLKYKVNSVVTLVSSSNPIAVDSDIPVEIRWGDLCSKIDSSNSSCTNSINAQVTVGIDANGDDTLEESVVVQVTTRIVPSSGYDTYTPCSGNTPPVANYVGLCDITLFKGDKKFYVDDFAMAPPWDLSIDGSIVKYEKLVFFYDQVAGNVGNNSSMEELTLVPGSGDGSGADDETPGLSDEKVTGLENDTDYYVAAATQDQAGNITNLTPSGSLFQVRPEEVVGILDDKKCFIATATFGSEMAPEVVTFRKFRNEFLLTNEPGRAFVKAYYKFGPIAAEAISQSPFLKSLSLGLLSPLLLFVKLSLAVGLLPALLMVLMAAVLAQRLVKQLLDQRRIAQEEP